MPPQQAVSRKAAAAATRTKLIESGLRLAERTGLTGLSVNLLVDEAGVSKGSFFHHFGDRASYLLALHREFHDRIAEQIDQAMGDVPPGRERLMTGARVYLDTCLQQRGIRALLLEARAEPAVAQEISRRNAEVAQTFAADFDALGRQHPLQSAQLFAAMTAEAALIELTAGSVVEAVRAALEEFLG
ncbi:AcrR family transcriptional regulator [Mycolicibacterium sp. BK556]|uniref:TetR/AcrR family transcriptional regulator n=1 Tax=Mycobacteriaceae TaxID=1762 RepID=UPI00105B6972|nr:TetR/AcrR family transcriptional regulator [Mycobacterium sp. BK086]MBB3601465.1 AcrR family transcriptional regulator [Mycolicibacterium sp. BK556]MBB3631217.1 AcrR family transcriptional regulator [Mycolicibacterium sp. BK607]MBB3749221.1 AcrR family transcriptional regulator [Mycolicibacterium sp. BK634]TDO14560.1 TetR family transcriptional regulator [Mycobacterium sp. BK086]